MKNDPDYVTGAKGRYEVSPPILHPPHCVCEICPRHRKTPADWAAEFPIRARRKSPYPDNRPRSTHFAFSLKAEEEARLFRAVGIEPPPSPIAPKTRRHPPISSYVYLIGCDASSLFKIGVTTNVRKRFQSIQTHSPTRLRLLAVQEGDANVEAKVHMRFSRCRQHGEWFALTQDAVEELVAASADITAHGFTLDGLPKGRSRS